MNCCVTVDSTSIKMAEVVDELFEVKNAFYTGNFALCIKESQRLKPTDEDVALKRDSLLYRSFIAQRKFGVVRDEIGSAGNDALKPLLTLADYAQNADKREKIADDVEAKLAENAIDVDNVNAVLTAAFILVSEGRYEAALRTLHSSTSDDLEIGAVRVQTLLKMDRVDLAKRELKTMNDADDDATLTQLATAWVNLRMGADKVQDAYYVYQELVDKFGSTATLLNGQAASFLLQAKFEEAEAALQEALEKDPSCPETLINMIVLAQRTGKAPEVSNRYLTQLRDENPTHPFVKSYEQKEADFARMVNQYAIQA